jgi:general secretion pathway protein A
MESALLQSDRDSTANSQSVSSVVSDYSLLFNSFFNFSESPFNNTPDPHFFFNSQQHRETLVNLIFGIENRRGFLVVTGEIGGGKTTICRQVLHQLPETTKTAVILNPNISPTHLMATIVDEFGIEPGGKTKRHYYEALNRFLLEGLTQGRNACIIIDEAQCLSPKVLDEIRLLSNLETSQKKLLQIVLMGQPELRELLQKPSLTQLRQRIGVHCHLRPLSQEDTKNYIEHRLSQVDQGNCELTFDPDVLQKIYDITRGIPRLINALCDRILMSAYAGQTKVINEDVANSAFEETAFVCAS